MYETLQEIASDHQQKGGKKLAPSLKFIKMAGNLEYVFILNDDAQKIVDERIKELGLTTVVKLTFKDCIIYFVDWRDRLKTFKGVDSNMEVISNVSV